LRRGHTSLPFLGVLALEAGEHGADPVVEHGG
jgi:hypothetical protein